MAQFTTFSNTALRCHFSTRRHEEIAYCKGSRNSLVVWISNSRTRLSLGLHTDRFDHLVWDPKTNAFNVVLCSLLTWRMYNRTARFYPWKTAVIPSLTLRGCQGSHGSVMKKECFARLYQTARVFPLSHLATFQELLFPFFSKLKLISARSGIFFIHKPCLVTNKAFKKSAF